MGLYHVAIPTDVSLLSLSRRRSRAAGLQRMTSMGHAELRTIDIIDQHYFLTGDNRKIFVPKSKTVDEFMYNDAARNP